MIEAFKNCMMRYATFNQRSSRKEFWLFLFGLLILQSVVTNIMNWISGQATISFKLELQLNTEATWAVNIFTALFIVPFMAALTRRFNDSGWQIGRFMASIFVLFAVFILTLKLWPIAPVYYYLGGVCGLTALGYFLFVTIQPSDPNPNQYGPNPNEVSS